MFTKFFYNLRNANIPVTLLEYLTLLKAVKLGLSEYKVNKFYYLARTCLVKDERNLDKFDLVFAKSFEGVEYYLNHQDFILDIPAEWLRSVAERVMTAEEMAEVKKRGGFEKLIEELQKRLNEQEKRHEGGSKWIGTGGTSPFGADGFNPEGIRIGQNTSHHSRALKVWDKRQYRDLDGGVEIGTRNMKLALRRLRNFARRGTPTELNLQQTIFNTARNGGLLDIEMQPERRNTIKVLILFDIGGSMDYHIKTCEELFSASKNEFKHLEYYYFHNCVYERLWRDNNRRHVNSSQTWDIIHTYGSDYKLIFVGDATMSPYEISYPGGSVEHWNDEPGKVWLKRFLDKYQNSIWLNPVPINYWDTTPTIREIRRAMGGRMFPLTIEGLDDGMRELNH